LKADFAWLFADGGFVAATALAGRTMRTARSNAAR
jgi:hypothetical protein